VSGYTPVFDSVFQGSLCGKYPDLPVWLVLLALQQRGGVIDAHPAYISKISGIPQADIEAAIGRFCEPDEESRTPDNDGRRLTPIEGAGFGWIVVNHRKYSEKARKMASDAQRAADGRNAERMAERKDADPRRPAQTHADPPSDSNTNTDKNPPTPRKRGKPAKSGMPEGFALTDELSAYVTSKIPDCNPAALFEQFCGQAKAKAWEYADWEQAFQTYVRNVMPNSGHWAAGQYPKGGNGVVRWR
jgi:hypothetical protein